MKQPFLLFIILSLFISPLAWSQIRQDPENRGDPAAENNKPLPFEQRNQIRLNLLPLLVNNYALEYERSLTQKMAVGATLSWRPNSGLPFKSTIEKNISDEDGVLQTIQFGSFSVIPELRFYLGKGHHRGFYIAPYVKYVNYNVSLDLPFDDEDLGVEETLPIAGNLTAFTAGFSVGSQWRLARNIFLDWRIFGPGFGAINGTIKGNRSLSQEEQDEVREALDGLDLGDIPIVKIDTEVDGNGASLKLKSPFAGIRTALSIGFTF